MYERWLPGNDAVAVVFMTRVRRATDRAHKYEFSTATNYVSKPSHPINLLVETENHLTTVGANRQICTRI